jgi:nitrite reductase/ring-hydroxylating ferredoxin subunit
MVVAREGDIAVGESLAVDCTTEIVAVFNVNGTYYAVSDMCPHAGGSLSRGWVEQGAVQCPWHGWSFPLAPEEDLKDGVTRYPVRVRNGEIQIEVPDS